MHESVLTSCRLSPAALGIGCNRGVSLATVHTAIAAFLEEWPTAQIVCLASHLAKADEPALCTFAAYQNWPLRLYTAKQLASVTVPHSSLIALHYQGTPSVAEAAALLAANTTVLWVTKRIYQGIDGKSVTLALARFMLPIMDANDECGNR